MHMDKYASVVERRIARSLVDIALADKKMISVWDGEEYTVKKSRDRTEILSALATTEYDILIFRDENGDKIGSVMLIWGNEDHLISDTTSYRYDYLNRIWDRVMVRAGVPLD